MAHNVREGLKLHMDTFFGDLQLAALDDLDLLDGPITRLGRSVLNDLDDLVALEDLAEDNVTAVEPTMATSALARSCCFAPWWVAYEVTTVVMKNWEPLVSLPALAMDRRPFLVCLSLKFSSGNFSP